MQTSGKDTTLSLAPLGLLGDSLLMHDNTFREKALEAIKNGKLPTRSPDRIMGGPDAVRRARSVAKQCDGVR